VKILRWVFWHIVYAVRPRPKEVEAYLACMNRLRSPWWRFKPSVYHNPDGKMWHVYLDNESTYTVPHRCFRVDLHVGEKSGRIVGLDIWDESLIQAAAEAAGGTT